MDIEKLICEDLIGLRQNAADAREAICLLGDALVRDGYIRPDYTKSVLVREREYPTGIALSGGGIAIPHAAPEGDVLKDGIAVLQLTGCAAFYSMENPEEAVEANIVFMLALKDSGEHLALLQKLFGMFQTESVMEELRGAESRSGFRKILIRSLK